MKKYLVLILILSLAGCKTSEKFSVVPVSDLPEKEEEKKQGIYYALPRTFINIDVQVIKKKSFRGPFAEYASKYLGIENVITENKTSYEIKDIKISTFYEPDPEQFYFVEFSQSDFKAQQDLMMELTESGLIVDVNNPSEFNASGRLTYTLDKESNDYSKTFKYFPEKNLYEKVDKVIRRIKRDTTTIEKQVLKRKMVEKSTEQKAKDAADFILKTREQKMKLLTGYQETPYSKETMKYMYEELEKMEEKYLKQFTGLTTQEVLNYRYTYLPPDSVFNIREPLFRFSSDEGVLKTDRKKGQKVTLYVDRQRNTRKMQKHIKKNLDSENEHTGFFYRLPEQARLTIKKGNTPKAEALYPISQFGIVNALPPEYDKIRFYPSTGMIRSIDTKEKKIK